MSETESQSILERMGLGQLPQEPEGEAWPDDGVYRAFGISRKAWGGEPMIDFISSDGNHQCFSYSHIYRIAFDPSDSIKICFTDHQVTIRGEQLHDLYRYLLMHRVVFVADADAATQGLIDSNEALVTELVFEERC